MQYVYTVSTFAIILAMTLCVVRAVKGPTLFDRVLAGNAVGTLAILLLIVTGFLLERPEWTDIGLTYALLNIVAALAILKYFRSEHILHRAKREDSSNERCI
ncbi:MAG: pH regulation protein F [Hyphomicrobiaceae bacterium]|nr:pH regulation protein F [Hyphomicrobiaceae bacterium]